ncbi:MAG: hypothetical protein K6L76_02575 [Agarilytica sp.]
MNKYALIFAIVLAFQFRGTIMDAINPPPDFSHASSADVIMYSTKTCGYCAKARRLFEKMNVTVDERDVESSQQYSSEFKQLGGRGVPLIVIGEEVIKGYSKNKIIESLEKL